MKNNFLFAISATFAVLCHGSQMSYNIGLNEHGTLFRQQVLVDEDRGLVITDVPAHHNVQGGRYVFDDQTGLMLDVVWEAGECLIHRAFAGVDSKSQMEIAKQVEWSQGYLNTSESATEVHLIQIPGPQLEHSDLPAKFAGFCPENFVIFTARNVPVMDDQVQMGQNGTMLVDDPAVHTGLTFGEPVPDFDDLFDFLPASAKAKSRSKRECRTADNEIVIDECHYVHVTCNGGCLPENMRYNCNSSGSYRCEYVLMCPKLNPSRKCLWHITANRASSCDPCCMNANCGGRVPRCNI